MIAIHYQTIPFYQLSLDQFYQIMKVRQDVFIVEQNCPYLDADGKDQDSHHVLGLDENGLLQAYIRILPPGLSYEGYASIGRVLNTAQVRGQGEGKRLMTYGIEKTRELYPNTPIKIGAQAYLLKFYESFGFQDIHMPYMEDGIPHLKMILA